MVVENAKTLGIADKFSIYIAIYIYIYICIYIYIYLLNIYIYIYIYYISNLLIFLLKNVHYTIV